MDASVVYFPSAVMLGALQALEPGHAKALTAAFLIGVKGTRRDAVLLGLSVAATHSLIVVLISSAALWLGRETFTDRATYWLQMTSGVLVIALGLWLLYTRWLARRMPQHARTDTEAPRHFHDHLGSHDHAHSHPQVDHHHHHAGLDEDAHARAHAATLPDYVQRGERPSVLQIVSFGAAGGLIPCPAAVSVMLLALTIGRTGNGLLIVLGFSLGLAATLVGIGLAVVSGLKALSATGRFARLSRQVPLLSAALVVFSGIAALAVAFASTH